MPFTIAHPAVILPLCKNKKFSSTALFAGSMVPDFEFFFQLREVENIGHHWYGIFFFDLPVAILLTYIFHGLLRDVWIAHLPSSIKGRFIVASKFNWHAYLMKYPLRVFISLIVGIASHLLWDGFTHHDGFFVLGIPFLLEKTGWNFLNIHFYFLLQLVFSVIGLIVVLLGIYMMPKVNYEEHGLNKKNFWMLLTLMIGSLLMIRIVGWPEYNSFGGLMIAMMGSVFYGWILASLLFLFIFKNQSYEY